jgi:hypothetical protein
MIFKRGERRDHQRKATTAKSVRRMIVRLPNLRAFRLPVAIAS